MPRIFLALNAAALIAAGAWMLSIAGAGHFSNLRLILIAGTFLLATLAAAGAVLLQLQPAKEQALHRLLIGTALATRLTILLSLLFSTFWCLTWFPSIYTGNLHDYFLGLYPLILWGTLASGSAVILMLIASHGSSGTLWRKYWLEHRPLLRTTIISLAGFAIIVLLTWALRILHSNEPYWRGAGVPILASQVFIALLIGVLALLVQAPSTRRQIPVDLLLFLLIWALSAIFWAAQPVPESFWVTGPMPPNHEYYPFSDLMTFDVGSQFALIGQGINNGVFWDRALYMSFLVYLHSLGGQNYQNLMSIQAAIFAVFPALSYLIGRKLHSRVAGLMLAALIMMRGLNSLIAAPWIHSSTFKHMLTDFPTAIGVAVFVLLILKWLESPRAHRRLLLWASGVLGLTSLLRPHVLLLLPAVGLLAIWLYWAEWKQAVLILGLVVLAFLASISPWTFLASRAGSIFALYGQRIHDVMQQRYPQLILGSSANSEQPEAPEVPLSPGAGPVPTQNPFSPVTPEAPLASSATPSPPGVLSRLKPPTSQLPFPVTQFMHNLVTSAVIFPVSPEFLSVLTTVKDQEDFWKFDWDGRMSFPAAAMLVLNLVILAFGLGAAYQLLHWRGLLPLVVFLVYHAANGLARTSGGRYLVPVDWLLVSYYAVGLAEVLQLGKSIFGNAREAARTSSKGAGRAVPIAGEAAQEGRASWIPSALATIMLLAMIGGLVPLAGVLYPKRYAVTPSQGLVDEISPYLPALNLNLTDVQSFLKQPGAVIVSGRALYARFYKQGKGELFSYGPFLAADYPRTVFVLIGPHGPDYVVLPGRAPKVFPNASDAMLLGCDSTTGGYSLVSAVAVVLPGQQASYARSPVASLTCPLPEPVCDDNGNCY